MRSVMLQINEYDDDDDDDSHSESCFCLTACHTQLRPSDSTSLSEDYRTGSIIKIAATKLVWL